MTDTKIIFSHVYLPRGLISAWVTTGPTGSRVVHKVGHLPREGWFCTCGRGKRCAQIKAVKALVNVSAVELGAANVRAGNVRKGEWDT